MTNELGTRIDARTVQFVRVLPGPLERIWAYLWDGEKRGEWFARGALPASVGERFDMFVKHASLSPNQAPPPAGYEELDRNGHHSHNVLLACEPPHRLLIALGPELYEASEVELVLNAETGANGDCVRLTLNHRKIPNRAYAIEVARGWQSYLAMLEHKLAEREPPAFWTVFRATAGVYEPRFAE